MNRFGILADMLKNHTLLIALAAAIGILAIIGVISSRPSEGTPTPQEEAPAALPESVEEKEGGGTKAPSAPTNATPPGAITSYTVWKTFVQDDWGISFKVVDSWELSTNDAVKDGEINQVSIDAGAFTALITEDVNIAEPARVSSRTYERTIAGREIEVREYTNPNDSYAYYLFFTISVGNDDYRFSIKSIESDRTKVDSFLSRISIK